MFNHKHLLSIDDLSREDIMTVLKQAATFEEVNERPIKKVPALRGKTVCNLFFEPSTRTRGSFELAEKRLSCDSLNAGGSASSTVKGESLVDTVGGCGLGGFVWPVEIGNGLLEVFQYLHVDGVTAALGHEDVFGVDGLEAGGYVSPGLDKVVINHGSECEGLAEKISHIRLVLHISIGAESLDSQVGSLDTYEHLVVGTVVEI